MVYDLGAAKHSAEIGVRKPSTYNNFCASEAIWFNFTALRSAELALQFGLFEILSYATVQGGCKCSYFWSSKSSFLFGNSSFVLVDRNRINLPERSIGQIVSFTLKA